MHDKSDSTLLSIQAMSPPNGIVGAGTSLLEDQKRSREQWAI